MHVLTGTYRVGRDAEVRYIPSGEAVVNLSLATNYGRAGEDGKKPTQWIDAGLWGKLAENLAQYLVRGKEVFVVMQDVHNEEYTRQDGSIATKMVGRIQAIELIGPRTQQNDAGAAPAASAPRPAAAPPAQRTAPAPRPSSGFDDMDDDIPF